MHDEWQAGERRFVVTERQGRSVIYRLFDDHVVELITQGLAHADRLQLEDNEGAPVDSEPGRTDTGGACDSRAWTPRIAAPRTPRTTSVLFPRASKNPDGKAPLSSSTYRLALYRWLERCEVRDEHGQPARLTLHQWKHTLGTRLINNDEPQEVVRRILDHDSAQRDRITRACTTPPSGGTGRPPARSTSSAPR